MLTPAADVWVSMQPIPAVLEIPSKEHPYDPNQDSILSRVKGMFGGDVTGQGT